MIIRLLSFVFILCFFLSSCVSSRSTTHWVVNNDSNSDVSLNIQVTNPKTKHVRTKTHIIKPGLQQLSTQIFKKGPYTVGVNNHDGSVSQAKAIHFDTETWLTISYINADSITLVRRYGYVDTATMRKIDGKYTGVSLYKETRKPVFLYNITAVTSPK